MDDAVGIIAVLVVVGLIIAAVIFVIVYIVLPLLALVLGGSVLLGTGYAGRNYYKALDDVIGTQKKWLPSAFLAAEIAVIVAVCMFAVSNTSLPQRIAQGWDGLTATDAPAPPSEPVDEAPAAPVFTQISEADLDVNAENRLLATGAEASGFLVAGEYSYPPENLLDNDLLTSWQVRTDQHGRNESVIIYFDGPRDIRFITMALGNCKNEEAFYENARPRTLHFTFSDGSKYVGSFDDGPILRCLAVSPHVTAEWVAVFVEDVYEGNKFNDLCISKINFYE